MAKATKEASKKEPKEKKEKKPLPALSDAGQKQLSGVHGAATALLEKMDDTDAVSLRHLREFSRALNEKIRAKIKAKVGDPAARKKARLEAKLAKIQEEIAALKNGGEK